MYRQYKIEMFTPIGVRCGSIAMDIQKNRITGFMTLLDHENPIEGTVMPTGQCKISGFLTTPSQNFYYTASGTLTRTALCLALSYKTYQYHINGTLEEERT